MNPDRVHLNEQLMLLGAREYADVIGRLSSEGLPAVFTQTGGMNAAIEVTLEAGFKLLITDAEDSLSWERSAQHGWGVGLYAPQEQFDGECIAFVSCDDNSVDALTAAVTSILLSQS